MLGVPVTLAVGACKWRVLSQRRLVWAHSPLLLVGSGVGRSGVAACGLVV